MKLNMQSLLLLVFLLLLYPGLQAQTASLDVAQLEKIIGHKAAVNGAEAKFTVPQNDLNVQVDGFAIIPPMGLGSWIAFSPTADGAMLMGDVVVQETELAAVQQAAIANGLTVTGLHNHFVRDTSGVMYMHVGGSGRAEALARGARAVLDAVVKVRGKQPGSAPARTVPNSLDTAAIAKILGHRGDMNRGVYKITIGRPDIPLQAHGGNVSTFMGFNTWAAWQGTPQKAAVAGDFAMLEGEVANVIKALVENGIEVVAVHNHMVHEEPRIFFLHYWGIEPAEKLARGLKAALDQTGKQQQQGSPMKH